MQASLVSEPDFIANILLPRLKEAAAALKTSDLLEFHVEKRIDGDKADLVVERAGRGLLVIEAKYRKKVAGRIRDIEPRDPEVVKQAVNYASLGGYPYYATCNPKRMILFQLRPGVRAYESEVASFEFNETPNWNEVLLKIVLGMVPARAKPLDDTLVSALHEAFSDLYGEFLSSLREKIKDRKFSDDLHEWLESQGMDFSDENIRKIAAQATYLQINKLLFYYTVRTIYPDKLKPVEIGDADDLYKSLCSYYEDVRKIDYAPIYQADLMSEIPFTERAKERFRTLISTLNEYDFSKMESDFIGRVYEKLIPPAERKRLGQFYTPPAVVDLIVKLTVKEKGARVLDPACGSGSFLVRAYHRLRELNGIPREMSGPLGESFHKQLLGQIYGIDINQFPAHLSVINLVLQNPCARVDKVNVIVGDFFDIRPRQEVLAGFESMTPGGEKAYVKVPYTFDVVVANPPYISQVTIGERVKKKALALIESEYRDLLGEKGGIVLDRTSDIYVYFYIHSIKFLKNHGMLGYISSNKWLEVEYGEPFQEFLLRTTKILCVVEFDMAVFPDAEVNTCIVILQKESDGDMRKQNIVRFVRVRKPVEQAELMRLMESGEDRDDEHVKLTTIQQGKLVPGKWNIYLRGGSIVKRLVGHPKMKPLAELAQVFRGLTTGCDEFFILERGVAEGWGIEKRYLAPIISSAKDAKGLVVREEDLNRVLFTAHDPRESLKGTGALKYIEHGERMEVEPKRGANTARRRVPELETVKLNNPWYSLSEPQVAPILMVKMMDIRPKALWNRAAAHASNRFYYIIPNRQEDTFPLLAFLNSSVGALLTEVYGRSYGGGVLELAAYELKRLPVIDPSSLQRTERERMSDLFMRLAESVDARIEAEKKLNAAKSKVGPSKGIGLFEHEAKRNLELAIKSEAAAQSALDRAIFDTLNLGEEEREQVESTLAEFQTMRRMRTKS